jgi:hypothetical protein
MRKEAEAMTDREKVIKHIMDYINAVDGLTNVQWVLAELDVLKDALALLKAQEPRLLGLDEIKMLGLMWLESRNGFVQPVICQNYEYCVDRSVEFIMVHGTICNSINTFGKLWRVWTSEPGKEQREAAKWND